METQLNVREKSLNLTIIPHCGSFSIILDVYLNRHEVICKLYLFWLAGTRLSDIGEEGDQQERGLLKKTDIRKYPTFIFFYLFVCLADSLSVSLFS